MDCDTQIRIFGYKKCQMKENRNKFEFLSTPESITRCHAGFQESRSPFLNFLEVWCMNEASWLASFPPKRPGPGKQFLSTFFHTQILFSCKYFRGYKVRDRLLLLLFWRKEKKVQGPLLMTTQHTYFRNKIFIYFDF